MKFFIADTHFYDKSIINFCNRPYDNIKRMNNDLINNWNNAVKKNDEIFIIGDMFCHRATIEECNKTLKKLNGIKYLITGNHDKYIHTAEFNMSAFEWIKAYHVFKENKNQYVLFHYPILEWEGFYQNSILLYGHVHNHKVSYFNEMLGPYAVNVGADLINFTPISIYEVNALINNRLNENKV